MPVPNTFASATSAIPLANLDTNFATPITLGNTAVQLGNTITTINSVTLVTPTINTITSGSGSNLVLQSNNAVTAVTIDTAQRVGIGTSSPSYKLDVSTSPSSASYDGTNIKNGANSTVIGCYLTGSSYSFRGIGASQSWLYSNVGNFNMMSDGGAITFSTGTNSGVQAILDTSGNLLVGTTSAPNASFACKSNFIGLQTTNPADSTKWRQIVFANNSTDATLYFPNGSNTATLTSAGAWTNASDSRQKTNIVDIKYGLNTVLTVQPHSYNRTDVSGDFIGFVAQELKTIIPEVVFGSEETSYSVDYGSLVAVAFKAIQELSAKVTALEAKVGI